MSRRTDVLETPAVLVGRRLQELGFVRQAAQLREAVPDDVSGDEHLELLRQRLISLAADFAVPPKLRAEADRLVRVAGDLAHAIGRCGTVYVAWLSPHRHHDGANTGYTCYWDQSPDGEAAFLEQGPEVPDLVIVREWAHARSDRIYVRPSWAPDESFWAGVPTLRPDDIEPLRSPPA
jgi:hypothetical protein